MRSLLIDVKITPLLPCVRRERPLSRQHFTDDSNEIREYHSAMLLQFYLRIQFYSNTFCTCTELQAEAAGTEVDA